MHDKCLGTFYFSSSFFLSSFFFLLFFLSFLLILYACSRVSLLFSSYRFICCGFCVLQPVVFVHVDCLFDDALTPHTPPYF